MPKQTVSQLVKRKKKKNETSKKKTTTSRFLVGKTVSKSPY